MAISQIKEDNTNEECLELEKVDKENEKLAAENVVIVVPEPSLGSIYARVLSRETLQAAIPIFTQLRSLRKQVQRAKKTAEELLEGIKKEK